MKVSVLHLALLLFEALTALVPELVVGPLPEFVSLAAILGF